MFGWLFGKKKRLGALAYAVKSEVGLVRSNNEDNYFVDESRTLFCVADGMGGGAEGEVASAIVVEEVSKIKREKVYRDRLEHFEAALETANQRIRKIAADKGYRQMGSTAVGIIISEDRPSRAAICHVGDSRAYRLRDSKIEPLTRDHTVGGELSSMTSGVKASQLKDRANPLAHMLTRALGATDNSLGDWKLIDLKRGDKLIICSDGVHDVITDDHLRKIMKADDEPAKIAARLEKAILKAGAPDNYTYIIINVGEVK